MFWVMQVGFGDVWKQSLSELSGGQRSLLALSLILAMLLFKPAPIYILDEVCLLTPCPPPVVFKSKGILGCYLLPPLLPFQAGSAVS